MTADNFYMDVKSDHVEISVQESTMKAEADIYIDDFAFALLNTNDNLDYLAKPVKAELIRRAESAWDLDEITDEELEHFRKVLEAIL